MAATIFTIYHRPGRELVAISDRPNPFAFLAAPVWAVWHRCWLALAAMFFILSIANAISPLAAVPAFYGYSLVLALEGSAIRGLELRLSGWREVGRVVAATEQGAEELFLAGEVA